MMNSPQRRDSQNKRGGGMSLISCALILLNGFIFGRLTSSSTPQFFVEQSPPSESSDSPSPDSTSSAVVATSTASGDSTQFFTVEEIKKNRMMIPCNYVHDGHYIKESNEVTNQVYQSLMELDDDIVPFIIEAGGHDGITKSMTLKSSRCLGVNTLLIDASPNNYKVLSQTRPYDRTIHAALCEDITGSVPMLENAVNSGENKIVQKSSEKTIDVPCTSLDAELDKIRDLLPDHQKDKLQLIFMVLDVEGFEGVATKGLMKHRPQKVMMEWFHLKPEIKKDIMEWYKKHNLSGKECNNNGQDYCLNYHPFMHENKELTKKLFYGARDRVPKHTFKTSEASQGYMFYGQ